MIDIKKLINFVLYLANKLLEITFLKKKLSEITVSPNERYRTKEV